MEKRSRRRTRDLVIQPAFQGLSENEIGCARISIMARSTSAPFKGRIQNRKTYHFHSSNLTCNARPVHTDGSSLTFTRCRRQVRYYSDRFSNRPFRVKRFQTNHHHSSVDVAHGLVLLFGIGTRPFHHGSRRRGGTIYRAALL